MRLVFWGVKETAQVEPDLRISWTPLADEVFLYGFGVHLLEVAGGLGLGHGDDLFQDGVGVFVAGVEALGVEDAQAAHPVHQGGEAGGYRAIHCGGEYGDVEVVVADGHLGGGHVGVDGDLAGNYRHFVESVGPFQFLKKALSHRFLPM